MCFVCWCLIPCNSLLSVMHLGHICWSIWTPFHSAALERTWVWNSDHSTDWPWRYWHRSLGSGAEGQIKKPFSSVWSKWISYRIGFDWLHSRRELAKKTTWKSGASLLHPTSQVIWWMWMPSLNVSMLMGLRHSGIMLQLDPMYPLTWTPSAMG